MTFEDGRGKGAARTSPDWLFDSSLLRLLLLLLPVLFSFLSLLIIFLCFPWRNMHYCTGNASPTKWHTSVVPFLESFFPATSTHRWTWRRQDSEHRLLPPPSSFCNSPPHRENEMNLIFDVRERKKGEEDGSEFSWRKGEKEAKSRWK